MRLVVTGASGFVGRGLLDRLAAGGHEGVATGRTPPAYTPDGWGAVRRDDLLDGRVAPGSVDALVHMEVKQHVPRPTAADIAEFERANVAGTGAWLEWASRHGVRRLVLTSSIKAVPADRGEEAVDGALDPGTPYGRSKAQAEAIVKEWAADKPGRVAVILRATPVYGPGNEANLAAFVKQVLSGRPCLIGRGDTRKSVVSRANFAAAIEFAVTADLAEGCQVFNVSDPETFSLAYLAGLIAELAGAPPPRHIPGWLAGCLAVVGDLVHSATGRDFPLTSTRLRALRETSIFPCEKLVAAGFRHPQSTREGLAEMLGAMASPKS